MSTDLVTHTGGCHCGAVKYEVRAPPRLVAYSCNCSICAKKQNTHFVVPHKQFKLLSLRKIDRRRSMCHCCGVRRANTFLGGEDQLSTYTFNTGKAKHMFCKVCGVQSFYQPRSNPGGYGVMPHCLDAGTVTNLEIKLFDGQNWETSLQGEIGKADSILKWSEEKSTVGDIVD